MSYHSEDCGAPGKFDCWADERVYKLTLDINEGEGSVDSPAGWFQPLDLDRNSLVELELVVHYATEYIIAREDERGFFWVCTYESEEARDVDLEELRAIYAAWEGEAP